MSKCDMCVYFVYNEEEDYFECLQNLDEDEMYSFLSSNIDNCPYFRLDDEYSIAKKQ